MYKLAERFETYKTEDCTGAGVTKHVKKYEYGECTKDLLGQWPGLIQSTHIGLQKIEKSIVRDDKLDEGHVYVVVSGARRNLALGLLLLISGLISSVSF